MTRRRTETVVASCSRRSSSSQAEGDHRLVILETVFRDAPDT